jgi:hypothetical protein
MKSLISGHRTPSQFFYPEVLPFRIQTETGGLMQPTEIKRFCEQCDEPKTPVDTLQVKTTNPRIWGKVPEMRAVYLQ